MLQASKYMNSEHVDQPAKQSLAAEQKELIAKLVAKVADKHGISEVQARQRIADKCLASFKHNEELEARGERCSGIHNRNKGNTRSACNASTCTNNV